MFILLQSKHIVMKRFFLLVLSVLLIVHIHGTTYAAAYEQHEPIEIHSTPSTQENPLIIEGYEISNPDGPAIQIEGVEYVIIRDCYVHDSGTTLSNHIQELVKETGDASHSTMSNWMVTGGISVFNCENVVIENNIVENNDFGIAVLSYEQRLDSVRIVNNTVRENHRSFFITVQNSDQVEIADNIVADNGLSLFVDNLGSFEAQSAGGEFPDGRTMGIVTHGSMNVSIHGNTVYNSSSDGIAATGGEIGLAQDIRIFNNTIYHNNEQGIWLQDAANVSVYNNYIYANRHRPQEAGGSSGINMEGGCFDVEIFENDIGYNDIMGVMIMNSSGISIHDNLIHHNVDGGIGFSQLTYSSNYEMRDVEIYDNQFLRNRVSALTYWSGVLDVEIYGNNFTQNGGAPYHYQFYEDHEILGHPEAWTILDSSTNIKIDNPNEENQIVIGQNLLDGVSVIGQLVLPEDTEPTPEEPPTVETDNEIETLNEEIASLVQEIQTLESINTQLNEEIEQLQNEKEQLTGQIIEIMDAREDSGIPGVPFTSIIIAFVFLYYLKQR